MNLFDHVGPTWAGIAVALTNDTLLTFQISSPQGSMEIDYDEYDGLMTFGAAEPIRRIWRPPLLRVELAGRITDQAPWSRWRPPDSATRKPTDPGALPPGFPALEGT